MGATIDLHRIVFCASEGMRSLNPESSCLKEIGVRRATSKTP
jgi:hypothetical protein